MSWHALFEKENLTVEDSAVPIYNVEHPSIQSWSMGDHFPAVIVRVENYSPEGILTETYHQVILGGITEEFHRGDTHDKALAWALNHIGASNGY